MKGVNVCSLLLIYSLIQGVTCRADYITLSSAKHRCINEAPLVLGKAAQQEILVGRTNIIKEPIGLQ